MNELVFIVVAACHQSVINEFDQHFQASVHFPLTSAVDKSKQHQNNFFGNARIETQGRLVRSKNAFSVVCSPPLNAFELFGADWFYLNYFGQCQKFGQL